MDFSFDDLRRWPDVEAPNLYAVDATDRLLLDTAATAMTDAAAGDVVAIGDRYGALALGAIAQHDMPRVRVHQDALSQERAITANAERFGLDDRVAQHPLDAALVSGARVVLLQLPRSLDALDEIAELIARHADRDVRVFAGGRVKHMTTAMNDVLRRSFRNVEAGLARQKSRVLTASGVVPALTSVAEPSAEPSSGPTTEAGTEHRAESSSEPTPMGSSTGPRWPRSQRHDEPALTVWAHGAAFAGTRIDVGTRFLLGHLDSIPASARTIVDLGCGTGVLATAFALHRPDAEVTATDQSAAATASAHLTADANGVDDRVTVVRDDGLSTLPDASIDAVLLNPPFHIGASVHTGLALKLFAEAGRVLTPGGTLLCVWNSHLHYRAQLERLVGITQQVARNARFTVTTSRRPG